jgi:hypothetical protein
MAVGGQQQQQQQQQQRKFRMLAPVLLQSCKGWQLRSLMMGLVSSL